MTRARPSRGPSKLNNAQVGSPGPRLPKVETMILRRLFLGLFALLIAFPASAQAVKLTGEEIRALLTGNTAVGRWEGESYRRYFGSDGVTISEADDAQTTQSEWRVDDELQEYQSLGSGEAEWEGWFVMEFGDTYYWVSRATPPTPFQVLEGEQLVAE